MENDESSMSQNMDDSMYRPRERTSRNDSETSSLIDTHDLPDYEYLLSTICDYCRCDGGKISIGLFLEELQRTGIRCTDPRLSNMMKMLYKMKPHTFSTVSSLKLDNGSFRTVLTENAWLVNKAFQNQFIIPKFHDFCADISEIYETCKTNLGGKCSEYIPSLANADHNKWGVSICTIDGQRYSIGDVEEAFTMQSTSNPLTYAVCLNELGQEFVHKYQGKAPSGRTFDEIALDHHDKPHNPLVNSGAILSAALILQTVRSTEYGCDMSSKYELVHNYVKRLSGSEFVEYNNTSFIEERSSSDRNFALAHFMRENRVFPKGTDVGRVMDLYFQFSNMEINCESGALIAGTLANGGVCPISGDQVLKPETVQSVRTLMYGCGMHNHSGKFAFDVGLPAKSGISGCILLVVPNVMGICLWSPPLDKVGNSERGIQFCQELVKHYSFHRFDREDIKEEDIKKVDPTLRKYENPGAKVIQMLLAAADGALVFLRRAWFQGVDLNQGDYDNRTPLHLASAEGHFECVYFLLKLAKVYPKPLDRWNHTPLEEAIVNGHKKIADLLREVILEWEAAEVEDEFETNDDENSGGYQIIYEGVDLSSSEIRITLKGDTPSSIPEDDKKEEQISTSLGETRNEDLMKEVFQNRNTPADARYEIKGPSGSSPSFSDLKPRIISRRNSCIEDNLLGATRGMQMLNFLAPSISPKGSPLSRRKFLFSSRNPSRSTSHQGSRRPSMAFLADEIDTPCNTPAEVNEIEVTSGDAF